MLLDPGILMEQAGLILGMVLLVAVGNALALLASLTHPDGRGIRNPGPEDLLRGG
jgi:hypothetical protein